MDAKNHFIASHSNLNMGLIEDASNEEKALEACYLKHGASYEGDVSRFAAYKALEKKLASEESSCGKEWNTWVTAYNTEYIANCNLDYAKDRIFAGIKNNTFD